MSLLDKHRLALLAVNAGSSEAELIRIVEGSSEEFVPFVISHGLGPFWHARTGREEFRESRLAAEALFLAQEHAIKEVDAALTSAGVEYVLIKGAATRLFLYEPASLRACFDLDILVRRDKKLEASVALVDLGYVSDPHAQSISIEVLLSRGLIDIDLHWELLREGRLRNDCATSMLNARRRVDDVCVLSAEDTFFLLLVHPAFAKHLGSWEMGLHRVADIVEWMRTQDFDWDLVRAKLHNNGVKTAAWASLRWLELLKLPQTPQSLTKMMADLRPGAFRRRWISWWLCKDFSDRFADAHWPRLVGFSLLLHDTLGDAVRAVRGRRKALRRSGADLDQFRDLAN